MSIARAAAPRIPADESVAHVFSEHAPFVFRTAYGVTGSHEDAEDVLQTVFLRLIRLDVPPDFRANPRAYLYRAALNAAFDVMRSRRRRRLVAVAELPEIPVTVDESLDEEHHRALYEAIAELKPESAQILVLRYVHNMSDAEIARMLGVSRGTIALRLFRSRARLRKLLSARLACPERTPVSRRGEKS
jgi:RNA polymerase sigma-70 factor (ECF subfamily)